MINWILGGLIAVAMFFALRYSLRKARKGECVGCSGCSSDDSNQEGGSCCCCHASQKQENAQQL